jgi:hypothetical protein
MIFDDNVSCIRGRDPIPADVESSGGGEGGAGSA